MSNEELLKRLEESDFDRYPIRVVGETETPTEAAAEASTRRDFILRDSRLFGPDFERLEVDGLTKSEFFSRNFEQIGRIIDAVNDHFKVPSAVALSVHEVLGVANAELGIKSGEIVDPKHNHGAGEFGLLPLSSIHKAVTGKDGPDPGGLYEPTINFEEFLMYMGGLKMFYAYEIVYQYTGISGSPPKLAHLAGAVIHGYFYSPNYDPTSSRPSRSRILDSIVDGSIGDLISKSTFKAAFAISGRMKNINDGIDLAEALLST